MLLARGRTAFRLGEAVLWAATWGLGAAIGVALGGWLTLVGGAGAPGITGLDPVSDLVFWPLGAFVAVFCVHLGAQLVVAAIRGRASERGEE